MHRGLRFHLVHQSSHAPVHLHRKTATLCGCCVASQCNGMLKHARSHSRAAQSSLGTAASDKPSPGDRSAYSGRRHAKSQKAANFFHPVMLGCIFRRTPDNAHPGVLPGREVLVPASHSLQPNPSAEKHTAGREEATGSWFARCISIIGSGALLSKVLYSTTVFHGLQYCEYKATPAQVLGLLREQLISSFLGLTGLADAFNLASTFPVLCLTGIGGLNGALHSATSSTAAQLPQNSPSTGDRQECAPTSLLPMSVQLRLCMQHPHASCQPCFTPWSQIRTPASPVIHHAGVWYHCKSLSRSATHAWELPPAPSACCSPWQLIL